MGSLQAHMDLMKAELGESQAAALALKEAALKKYVRSWQETSITSVFNRWKEYRAIYMRAYAYVELHEEVRRKALRSWSFGTWHAWTVEELRQKKVLDRIQKRWKNARMFSVFGEWWGRI